MATEFDSSLVKNELPVKLDRIHLFSILCAISDSMIISLIFRESGLLEDIKKCFFDPRNGCFSRVHSSVITAVFVKLEFF